MASILAAFAGVGALQTSPQWISEPSSTRYCFSSLAACSKRSLTRGCADNEGSVRQLGDAKVGPRFGDVAICGRDSHWRRKRRLLVAASAGNSSAGEQVTDHLVYFKVKEGTSDADADTMVEKLRGLASVGLDGVLEVHCGKALELTAPAAGHFTHALHVRCRDHAALHGYAVSPEHVDVSKKFVRPILEDICAVDWDVTLQSEPVDLGVGAVHTVVFKLKENTTAEQEAALIEGLVAQEGTLSSVRQISSGPGFEPGRAQGFTHGFIGRFASIDDLKSYGTDERHKTLMREKVFPFVEKFASVDFSTA